MRGGGEGTTLCVDVGGQHKVRRPDSSSDEDKDEWSDDDSVPAAQGSKAVKEEETKHSSATQRQRGRLDGLFDDDDSFVYDLIVEVKGW